MKRHSDTMFGGAMAVLTWLLAHPAEGVSVSIGVVSLGIMLIRFRREWRHRDD